MGGSGQLDPPVGMDVSDAVQQWVEERCVHPDHSHDRPLLVWNDSVRHFREECGEKFVGNTRRQVTDLVYRTRNDVLGGDVISKVESQYSGPQNHAFLRHSSSFTDANCMQKMMCFSKPEFLDLLSYPEVSFLILFALLTF